MRKNVNTFFPTSFDEYQTLMRKTQDESEIAKISDSTDPTIRQIVCGANHTFILKESGELFAFGENSHGELGLGDCDNRKTPTLLMTLMRKNVNTFFPSSFGEGQTLTPKAQVESEFVRIPDSTDNNIVSINGVNTERIKWDPKKYFTLSVSKKKIIKNFLLVCHHYKKKYNINMVKYMRHFIISLLF